VLYRVERKKYVALAVKVPSDLGLMATWRI
jgi:hypothetical protein